MTHQFAIGDTVRIKRSGLEVEVSELHPTDPARVLCCWINEPDELMEVYFSVDALDFVRAREQPVETAVEIPDKPVTKPRKRKAVETE